MEPGREMDAAVAEHVMGWEFKTPAYRHNTCSNCGRPVSRYAWPSCRRRDCHYSTDDDAAWAVVRAMVEKEYVVTVSYVPMTDGSRDGWASIEDSDENVFCYEASTLAEAVCVAALRALGVEI